MKEPVSDFVPELTPIPKLVLFDDQKPNGAEASELLKSCNLPFRSVTVSSETGPSIKLGDITYPGIEGIQLVADTYAPEALREFYKKKKVSP